MIELTTAMSILVIGVLGVFTMFHSSLRATQRAGQITTAAVLADTEMERFRGLRYDALGLPNAAVDAADSVYKSDPAFIVSSSASTTLSGALTAGATSLAVASGGSFPSQAGFRVVIDSEILRVTGGAGTSSWTVKRGVDGTIPASHSSGGAVAILQRVDVNSCGSSTPCTNLVPTKTVTGADGRTYRIDTYASWAPVLNASGAQGRLVKLMTVLVRDQQPPHRVWAHANSTFDYATGT